MTDPVRTEKVVRFTRMVQDSIVRGLRLVFTSQYLERQLKDIRIVTEYPLTRQEYPAIIVDFNDTENRDAGVGHREVFYDPNGILRVWGHRRFEGSITFRCYGLTPLDRDVMYDALVECMSFWRLPSMSLQANLFTSLYGDPSDPEIPFSALSQLFLNTGRMTSGGKSVAPAPWGSEDALVFQKDLTVQCIGGFYNSIPGVTVPGSEYITDVFIYPHIYEVLQLPVFDSTDYPEVGGEIYDHFVVDAEADASATETFTP